MRRVLALAAVAVITIPIGLMASTGTGSAGVPIGFDPLTLRAEIPEPMLSAYLDAAATWQIDWALLAAIGKLECDHGRYIAPGCSPAGTVNGAGARGPMQFLGSTWRSSSGQHDLDVAGPPTADGNGYATDGDGDGIADPWSAYDAVHGAARFLLDLGGRDDPRLAAKGYNAGPNNSNPTAGEAYASSAVALIAEYHALAGYGGPGAPIAAVVLDGYALPFEPAGLRAVTSEAQPSRDPEWALVKPHHSGRVATDIPLPVGTALYALVDGTVTFAGLATNCGNTISLRHAPQQATITYCHLSRIDIATGDVVEAGQWLGRSGGEAGSPGSGNSTGPHLHLQIVTPTGRRCPQAILLGLWRQWPVPTINALRTAGCTYDNIPPAPQSPAPIPPDLPIPNGVDS